MIRIRLYILVAISCYAFQLNAQSADTLFLEAAIVKLQHAKVYTLAVAGLMPAEFYAFRPSPKEMTFGEQLLHLSANLGWLSSTYLMAEENPVRQADLKVTQKDSVIAVVNRAYGYAELVLRRFPSRELKDKVTFFAGPMNKLQIINLINDHQTHHRGQLLVYLRLKNITPPSYVGW
jgi:uncharacterized damage-inducible protein DinB